MPLPEGVGVAVALGFEVAVGTTTMGVAVGEGASGLYAVHTPF